MLYICNIKYIKYILRYIKNKIFTKLLNFQQNIFNKFSLKQITML